MSLPEPPEARPGEIAFALTWRLLDGYLSGELRARNIGDHRVRLSNKPVLRPLGLDGRPLDAETVVTMELKMPPYVELEPGEQAVATAGWSGWDGPAASGRVLVGWPGGEVEVAAEGPREPEVGGPATNLFSSWFERVD